MTDELDPRDGIAPSRCPSCNYRMDAASVVRDSAARPTAGDVSICFKCSAVLIFANRPGVVGLVLRAVTYAELALLPEEHRREIARASAVVRRFWAARKLS
jgi:hypothetical protein